MKPDTLSTHEVSPDCGRLLDEADRLLDEYDFTGSVAAFREAAHLGPLTSDWLMNFRIAEENEQIEFRKQLTRMFPASLDLALDEVEALGRAGFGPQAVARCSDLLKSSVLTPMQIRLIRHARFEVARKTRESALFADDFLYLWGESNALDHPARVQASLLKALIAIDSPGLLLALSLIRDRLNDEPELLSIIASKTEQLLLLQKLKQAGRGGG